MSELNATRTELEQVMQYLLDNPEDDPGCARCSGPLLPPHNKRLGLGADGLIICAACLDGCSQRDA